MNAPLATGAFSIERAERIVISPFANERVREWPTRHFRRFIQLITGNKEMRVFIVGTQGQRTRANELVRGFSAVQVVNACGRLKWDEVGQLIDSAGCIITNNSGIGHVAAKRGAWTLCIFAASHAWTEWMPRGPRVVLITRMTKCAPCELGSQFCPNGIACMEDLSAEAVYARFLDLQARQAEEPLPAHAADRAMPAEILEATAPAT
jgi:ADP-heptose:LPS heptosyltransferase